MDVASEMAHRYLAPNFFLIHARFQVKSRGLVKVSDHFSRIFHFYCSLEASSCASAECSHSCAHHSCAHEDHSSSSEPCSFLDEPHSAASAEHACQPEQCSRATAELIGAPAEHSCATEKSSPSSAKGKIESYSISKELFFHCPNDFAA